MRLLLTGATGFLGSALARHWIAAGHQVWLLARATSSTRRIDGVLSAATLVRMCKPGADLVDGLVADIRPDVLIHTACSYGRQGESHLQLLDANVYFGAALLQALMKVPDLRTTVINTGTVLESDVSLYAASKHLFSQWGASLARQSNGRMQFIDVQQQQMYGPHDDGSKFTTHVLHACARNEPRLALTAGEQQRDFIHIDDVVRAYDVALNRRDMFANADSIEVGSGAVVTMREFVELVHRLTGASTQLDFGAVPYRQHEAMRCVADVTRLKSLGWRPHIDLATGLRQTLAQEALQHDKGTA